MIIVHRRAENKDNVAVAKCNFVKDLQSNKSKINIAKQVFISEKFTVFEIFN